MERLVDAYLDYRSRDSGSGMPSSTHENAPNESPSSLSVANIELVDMFSKLQRSSSFCQYISDSPCVNQVVDMAR